MTRKIHSGEVSCILERASAVKVIAPLIPHIYGGLEAGIAEVHRFFEGLQKPVDLWLAPNMVRFFLKEHLQDKVMFVEDCETEDAANNAISLRVGSIHLRVWKAADGSDEPSPPSAGRSRNKARFLRQLRPVLQLRFRFAEKVTTNLVLLWKVTKDYSLQGLFLACPKFDPSEQKPVEWEWCVPIDPADVMGSLTPLLEHEYYDLPFTPIDQGEDDEEELKDEQA